MAWLDRLNRTVAPSEKKAFSVRLVEKRQAISFRSQARAALNEIVLGDSEESSNRCNLRVGHFHDARPATAIRATLANVFDFSFHWGHYSARRISYPAQIMELLKVKTARFGEVIKQSGIPHVVTLWQGPKKDKSFQQAVREQRVMTVHQTTVGTKKDFAEVGFLQGPNLTHLVFPESLKAYAGRRVIGIDYDVLAEKSSSSGPPDQESRARKGRTAKQTIAKRSPPGKGATRTDLQPEQSKAPPKRKRKVAATTDALQRLIPSKSPATPPSDPFMSAALKEARKSLQEGGIPIGSALVRHGELLAVGHNKRVQEDDPVTHAETDCLRNGGRLGSYRGCTLYSTLMPCFFCAGAAVQFGIKRVIVGESRNFAGAPDFMREHGIEVVNLDLPECYEMMGKWIRQHPKLWDEDIGRP